MSFKSGWVPSWIWADILRRSPQREALHCDGPCGKQLLVKPPSGLCPYCRSKEGQP